MAKTIGDLVGGMVPAFGDQQALGQGLLSGEQTDNSALGDLLGLRPKKREGWRNVVGTILDVVAAGSGFKPQYWTGINDEKARWDDFQQDMAMEGFRSRQRLEEQRAKAMQPPDPTSLMQNFEFLRDRYGEDFAKDYVMKPTFVQNWDGTRTQVGGGGDAPDQLPADFFGDGGAGSGQPGFR